MPADLPAGRDLVIATRSMNASAALMSVMATSGRVFFARRTAAMSPA
jgi:hypothetical protein